MLSTPQAPIKIDDELYLPRLRVMQSRLLDKMIAFCDQELGPSAMKDAWELFSLESELSLTHPTPEWAQIFLPWFLHSWTPIEAGDTKMGEAALEQTPAQLFYSQKFATLSELEVRFLACSLVSAFSFFEVIQVFKGEGFLLTDLLLDETYFVAERVGSTQIVEKQILFTQVVSLQKVARLNGCAPFSLSPEAKQIVLEFRSELEKQSKPITPVLLQELGIDILTTFWDLIYP